MSRWSMDLIPDLKIALFHPKLRLLASVGMCLSFPRPQSVQRHHQNNFENYVGSILILILRLILIQTATPWISKMAKSAPAKRKSGE
jgi:hypothetical protein